MFWTLDPNIDVVLGAFKNIFRFFVLRGLRRIGIAADKSVTTGSIFCWRSLTTTRREYEIRYVAIAVCKKGCWSGRTKNENMHGIKDKHTFLLKNTTAVTRRKSVIHGFWRTSFHRGVQSIKILRKIYVLSWDRHLIKIWWKFPCSFIFAKLYET